MTSRSIFGFGQVLRADLKSLGRNATLLFYAVGSAGFTFGLYFVILPFYLLTAGYDATLIGFVGLTSGVAALLFAIPAGMLADAYGRRRMLLAGFVLLALSLVLMVSSTEFALVLVAATMGGIGNSMGFTSFGALLAGSVEPGRLDIAYSIQFFMLTLASAAGATLGWLPDLLVPFLSIDRLTGLRITMLVGTAVSAFGIMPILRLQEKRTQGGRGFSLKLQSKNVIVKFMAINIFIGFGAGLTIPLFPVYYAKKFGVGSGPMGTLIAVAGVIGALAYLAAPGVSKRLGPVRAVTALSGLSIPLLVLIPLSAGFVLSIPFFVARQALINMGNPLIESILMRMVQENERATASGVVQLFWTLPNSLGQPIGGYMIDRVWVDLPPFTTAAFYSVFSSAFFLIFRRAQMPSTVTVESPGK